MTVPATPTIGRHEDIEDRRRGFVTEERCRIEWCRRLLSATTYSFGDGLGNVYHKCGGSHWTPEPPPVDIAAVEACDEDD